MTLETIGFTISPLRLKQKKHLYIHAALLARVLVHQKIVEALGDMKI